MDGAAAERDARASAPAAATQPRRWVFIALGWLFFCLGVVGILLPVVPTTPFMLLALWAFSNGSQRFHDWLYHHRIFGPPLQRWRRERVIPWWTKAIALGSMAASALYVGLVVRPPWYGLLAMAVLVASGVAYLSRIPTRPRPPGPA
jgi:uncharacterized membrane protein YbaN (DUF454 family)